MSAPPGALPVASPDRSHLGQRTQPLNAAMVRAVLAAPGLSHLSTMQAHRAVRAFISSGAEQRYLAAWVIAYADPTGETAVRNVMSAR